MATIVVGRVQRLYSISARRWSQMAWFRPINRCSNEFKNKLRVRSQRTTKSAWRLRRTVIFIGVRVYTTSDRRQPWYHVLSPRLPIAYSAIWRCIWLSHALACDDSALHCIPQTAKAPRERGSSPQAQNSHARSRHYIMDI
jgi:hypothetical protein